MKNIHLIPTDKPSRLHEYGYIWFKHKEPTECFRNYNIYITSNEEIKEGDYVCASGGFRFVKTLNNDKAKTFEDDGIVSKQSPSSSCHLSNYKKIILTTDQDLIKDGVQAIDDEFLEWFVMNPSCEEVEVTYDVLKPFQSENKGYLIHCPDNEVLEEPKQETTLEEAADKYAESKSSSFSFRTTHIRDFTAGAKWQKERMYSEEDMKQAFKSGRMVKNYKAEWEETYSDEMTSCKYEDFEQWFEQFKKK